MSDARSGSVDAAGEGPLRVAVLTASDACAAGERDDRSGELLADWVRDAGHRLVARTLLPDDADRITLQLLRWADSGDVDVILTTGGTGFGPRDTTPEATRPVLEREAPGIAEALRRRGEASMPYAVLSRGLAGSRGACLVVNLPGSPAGVREGTEVLHPLVGHVVRLLRGERADHAAAGDGAP